MRGLSSIFFTFCNELNKLKKYKGTNVRLYLLYDIKITLKSNFLSKNVILLSLCTQSCYGRHNVPENLYGKNGATLDLANIN